MEFIREDCIYARQSVDRKDSISIESQIDFCKYELKGGSCRVFKDKGYSGKNTDRPEFQKLSMYLVKSIIFAGFLLEIIPNRSMSNLKSSLGYPYASNPSGWQISLFRYSLSSH